MRKYIRFNNKALKMKYADILFRYSDSPITLKYFHVPMKYIENASKMAS